MTEPSLPSSSIPDEIADADVEREEREEHEEHRDRDQDQDQAEPERVELDLDEEKLEAWEAVRSDYEVDPGGRPVPNSMDQQDPTADSPASDHSSDADEPGDDAATPGD